MKSTVENLTGQSFSQLCFTNSFQYNSHYYYTSVDPFTVLKITDEEETNNSRQARKRQNTD